MAVMNTTLQMITHVPLLTHLRPLFDVPRDPKRRMEAYLRLLGARADGIAYPPLQYVNPMSKAHVATFTDTLIAMELDELATTWVNTMPTPPAPHAWQHGFGIVDDVAGGWSERSTIELASRQPNTPAIRQGWVSTVLFVSDGVDLPTIQRRMLRSITHACWYAHVPPATTLREILRRERHVATVAHHTPPLAHDEITYTMQVLAPLLDSTHYHVHVAALFGDAIAAHNGFPTLGLSPNAGWALAGILDQVIDDYLHQ